MDDHLLFRHNTGSNAKLLNLKMLVSYIRTYQIFNMSCEHLSVNSKSIGIERLEQLKVKRDICFQKVVDMLNYLNTNTRDFDSDLSLLPSTQKQFIKDFIRQNNISL